MRSIVKAYPRSCLARFYLAFVLMEDENTKYDSQDRLRQALAVPGMEDIVVAWDQKHPQFCPLFVDCLKVGIDRADEFVERLDKDDPAREALFNNELRKPDYHLFAQALLLAKKLDPASPKIEWLLATTDILFGRYEQSYARLTDIIDSLSRDPDGDVNILIFCRYLRGRVRILLADDQRKHAKFGEQTVRLLKDAVDELQWCHGIVGGGGIRATASHALKVYRVVHDELRATLTLAEVEMDLQQRAPARKHLGDATGLMRDLKQEVRLSGLKKSTIEGLEDRLEEANKRFKAAESVASRSL